MVAKERIANEGEKGGKEGGTEQPRRGIKREEGSGLMRPDGGELTLTF
jgi:hypothetical protein